MARGGRSRSPLFLMEQLIAIAVFAFCAAVCVSVLAASYRMGADAVDRRYALLKAENAAEAHKAFGGDIHAVAALLGGKVAENRLVMHFDAARGVLPSPDGAAFTLRMVQRDGARGVVFADICVVRVRDYVPLARLTTAARNGARAR